MDIKFVEFDEIFCEKSWQWLNDPEIKKLTLTLDFSREQQIKGFQALPARNDYLIWGITYNSIPIGVTGIKNIDISASSGEYFGYIGEKSYWSHGIGKMMMEFTKEQAQKIELRYLYLHVSHGNERAIRLYLKYGYKPLMSQSGLDVITMAADLHIGEI